MGTLVCFHAHPDDESIATGGTIARAVSEGHRVVLVVATDGDHGEVPADLNPGESLADRRRRETAESAEVLGISEVVWLGYKDSGMTGWEQNHDPESFLQAETESAALLLADVLRREQAEVLTIYDWHGGYGHPDHIKVHHVGIRAAELAGTSKVFEATMNRDAMRRGLEMARELGVDFGEDDFDPDGPADDGNPMGLTEAELTHGVDVSAFVEQKRASLRCHRSQITDTAMFSAIPDEYFLIAFGTEWYRKRGTKGPVREGWLFE